MNLLKLFGNGKMNMVEELTTSLESLVFQ
jgi:hypothetical protein